MGVSGYPRTWRWRTVSRGGLTARQLVILGVSAIVCYGVFSAASSVLPTPVAAALAVPLALVGVALALGRLDGLTGDRIALAAARHLTLIPAGASPHRKACPASRRGRPSSPASRCCGCRSARS